MIRYILKRLLMMIPVLFGVAFVIFTMLYFTPGDPAVQILGEGATPEAIAALREELGLNAPFVVRFFNYIKDLVWYGDLGISYSTNRPVIDEILSRFPTTLELAALSVLIATCIGVFCGIIAAVRQYSIFDNVATVVSLIGASMPNFWQGIMMILLFSVYLGWLPASGFDSPICWIMPAMTIGTSTAAGIMRMTRSSMLEVIRKDYIRTARAKGQSEFVVIFHHALKNAMIPVLTTIGLSFGRMMGGAVLTESIFAIPGLGSLIVNSIKARDYPVVQGGVLFIAFVFGFVNLFVDILYAFCDPRIKAMYGSGKKRKKEVAKA
ncbi:MAG: ABC transporter permease [Lachnospiraceae bacterium]|nr:ABC transporter permease [Lachnospiraceae bacterium]